MIDITSEDFMNESTYKSIIESIMQRNEFNHEVKIKKLKFSINSSHASCDWHGGITKKDDYIVCYHTSNNTRGGGGPLTINECLERFDTYEHMKDFIDNEMNRYRDYEVKTEIEIKEEQISMFG